VREAAVDDRTIHFAAAVAAFIGGWLMGARRGYNEAIADSERLEVATNKLQAMMCAPGKLCPRCAGRSLPAGPGAEGKDG
jgi:hypothetical protein